MYMFLTQQQADDLARHLGGLPDYVRIIPRMSCGTSPENLHPLLERHAGKLETNINKNNETALHRILLN